MSQENKAAYALRRLIRSMDIEDHAHLFEAAAEEARDVLRQLNMPAIYEFNDDVVDRADAMGLKPHYNEQSFNSQVVIDGFSASLDKERADAIAAHFGMEKAGPKQDALWLLCDDDEDMYMSIFEGRDGIGMEFGPGRLVEMLEFMESESEPSKS